MLRPVSVGTVALVTRIARGGSVLDREEFFVARDEGRRGCGDQREVGSGGCGDCRLRGGLVRDDGR